MNDLTRRPRLMRWMLVLSSLLLNACDTNDASPAKTTPLLNPLTEIKAKLAFTCAHETIPAPSAEADVLFQYARWLQKNNLLKQDTAVYQQIERLYRIAAENGHYKASINLQNGAMRGHFMLRGEESLRLSQQLIEANVATGYYFIGIFLEQGAAGLKKDPEMALRYYRKAADMGSAQAQYLVGDRIAPINIAPDVARQMHRCAAEQGNGKAAVDLGIDFKIEGQYREAIEMFQMGVVSGYESAAGWLEEAFRGHPATDELHYLGQQEDLERAERYKTIWRILANYSYASPKSPKSTKSSPCHPPNCLPGTASCNGWKPAGPMSRQKNPAKR